RLVSIVQKDRTRSFTYDAHGFLENSTDALWISSTLSHNPVGRTLSVDAASATLGATFDAGGDLTELLSPLGYHHTFAYDSDDRRTAVAPASRPAAAQKPA